jgi:hypothetical protein
MGGREEDLLYLPMLSHFFLESHGMLDNHSPTLFSFPVPPDTGHNQEAHLHSLHTRKKRPFPDSMDA